MEKAIDKKIAEFDILSPDGFSIFPDRTYTTLREGQKAFLAWRKQYKAQGYYSSNRGRILLADLGDECIFSPIKK